MINIYLNFRGYAFNSTSDFEIIRDLKEKYCFVSCDYERDKQLDLETTYYNTTLELPDKRVIRFSNEKFEATEILFKPYLAGYEGDGIHEITYKSINVK